MADLTLIREGLAANLAGLTGIDVQPRRLPNPVAPGGHVFPGGPSGAIEYDLAMQRGLDRWAFTVQLFVGMADAIGSSVLLDTFMASSGPQSVKEQLESDRTLGGIVDTLNVVSCSGERVYVREGAAPMLGAEWIVDLWASGQ